MTTDRLVLSSIRSTGVEDAGNYILHDEVDCDKYGEIEVKGLAYPVATYQVNECYDTLKKLNRFREESHAMKIDLNLDAMTSDEQSHAAKILKRALARLEGSDSELP